MGAEDWERFAKTSDQSDRRWLDGLLGAIREELSSPKLSAASRAGDPFELLCAAMLDAQPSVATVERVPVEYDWNTDLIGKDENGRSVWYVQCKFWDVRKKATMNEVAAWIAKVENKIAGDWSGQPRIDAHAAWVTTGLIHDGATGQVVQARARSGIQFQIWDHDVLCHTLLTSQGVGFVKTESRGGAEYVAVNRAALREFRLAAEAELGETPAGAGRANDEESARPRFLPTAERRQALEEVLRGAEEPLPFGELLAKAGEWLGLSEAEQRFAESGKPIPLFEWLMTQALEDMRNGGVAERHSGQRWSLASQGEPAVGGDAQEPSDGVEVARPRFLPAAERRQAIEEVLRVAGEPLPFGDLLAKAGEWLGLSEGEQRFAEPGRPTPLFEFLMTQALEDLRKEGAAELHSGRRWSLSAPKGSVAEAKPSESASGGDPGNAEEVARPRFLSPAERRQAIEEVLRAADEPMPFEELLGKTGEWLGLPEAEQSYTEPGEPVPFFEHLMSMALEDLREEGVAERHSGRRWSLTSQGESAVQAGTAQSPPISSAEVARPRYLPPTERRQAIEEVLRAADEPVPFEELLAKAGEWLGLSEGEQRFAEPGKPMPLFEFLISQALEDLRQDGAAELQSGRRWSITSDIEPAAKAGAAQEPPTGGAQVARPRFLPPTERRQAIEEVLRAADEPVPFEELLAKAGEWLGLSEGEQRFAEPGKPMPLFEFLISQALEDLRQDGAAELQSGRRWSLSAHRGSATEASPAESGAGGVPDRAGEAARPRFLSPAERQQALEEVLRDVEVPMLITEVLAKAGEWLGVSESEQRYAEPGRPTPLFEHLMSMALEDLREAGVVERHSGQRWSLARSQREA